MQRLTLARYASVNHASCNKGNDTMAKNTGKLMLCALVDGVPVPMVESHEWCETKGLAWNNQSAAAEKWLKANRAVVAKRLVELGATGATFAKFHFDDKGAFDEAEVFELTPEQKLQRAWNDTYNTFKGSLGESVAKTIADTTHAALIQKLNYKPTVEETSQDAP